MPLAAGYSPEELERLRGLATRFLYEKSIEGARGLTLEPGMRAMLAVQASVPVLNLGLGWYRGWVSVVVYPDEFLARHEYVDEAGVVHQVERELSGESWPEGPVILSWSDIVAGAEGGEWGNVVLHELAHKLDLLNGEANGMPPLHREMPIRPWTEAFTRAYTDFCDRVDRGALVPLDEYAAEDPGEFFAVLSEAFFLHPHDLRDTYPEVYEQLARFYRQDPAGRLEKLSPAMPEGARGSPSPPAPSAATARCPAAPRRRPPAPGAGSGRSRRWR
jgi:hypothetical protein